jgi:hypothetical protein
MMRRMKGVEIKIKNLVIGFLITVLVVGIGSFCAGYFPERSKRRVLEREMLECRKGLEIVIGEYGTFRRNLAANRLLVEQLESELDQLRRDLEESRTIIERLREYIASISGELRALRARRLEDRELIERHFRRYGTTPGEGGGSQSLEDDSGGGNHPDNS